jgi:thymidylate synthase
MTVEQQLNNLIRDVLENGVSVDDPRTGESTRALFDSKIVVDEGEFPFFTNVLASPRLAFEELWFMLSGETDTKKLEAVGVNFWKGNTSRESLDKVGLGHLNEGELGSAYSCQWRNSGGYSWSFGKSVKVSSFGVDQLNNLISGLVRDKYSRRHLITLWNPKENKWGCITPCHHTSQYVVLPNKDGGDTLHVKLVNRSLDCVFGLRYAIMQYRMFQMVLCKMFGFKLGRLSLDLSQYHVYTNQIEYAKELLEREGGMQDQCSLKLRCGVEFGDIYDLLELRWDQWQMSYKYNKQPFIAPRPDMVA